MSEKAKSGGKEPIFDFLWNTFKSMKFAVVILLIITAASIFNLFANEFIIPVPNAPDAARVAFERAYGGFRADVLMFMQMYAPYRSWWFTSMLALLLLSLVICVIERSPKVIKKIFKPRYIENKEGIEKFSQHAEISGNDIQSKVTTALNGHGYKVSTESDGDKTLIHAVKNAWVFSGELLTHVGFVLLIIGSAMIARGSYQTSASGLPGDLLSPNETAWGFNIRVDDFQIEYHPLQAGQYVEVDSSIIGMITEENSDKTFDVETYSPSRGSLSNVEASRISNRIDRRFQGNRIDQTSISDYIATLTIIENGQEIATRTIEVNRPLRHKGFRFYQAAFDDRQTDAQGRWTTVITVRKDRGAPIVWIGILMVSLGLVVGMYFSPVQLFGIFSKEKDSEKLLIAGKGKNRSSLFEEKFNSLIEDIKSKL
jgi:cytochrome c biogenesis protein ResB